MKRLTENPPPLLHNSGYAPRASIVWYGFGRGPLSDDAQRIEAARGRGAWLLLSLSIAAEDPRWRRDWNTAVALLGLVDPGHGLGEAQAACRLTGLIDEHALGLGWPPALLVGQPAHGRRSHLRLDHPLTAFVAVAKSTGNLWLRDRPARLAPLHAPERVGVGLAAAGAVDWRQLLWFPEGIPEGLLRQVGGGAAPAAPRGRPGA